MDNAIQMHWISRPVVGLMGCQKIRKKREKIKKIWEIQKEEVEIRRKYGKRKKKGKHVGKCVKEERKEIGKSA